MVGLTPYINLEAMDSRSLRAYARQWLGMATARQLTISGTRRFAGRFDGFLGTKMVQVTLHVMGIDCTFARFGLVTGRRYFGYLWFISYPVKQVMHRISE